MYISDLLIHLLSPNKVMQERKTYVSSVLFIPSTRKYYIWPHGAKSPIWQDYSRICQEYVCTHNILVQCVYFVRISNNANTFHCVVFFFTGNDTEREAKITTIFHSSIFIYKGPFPVIESFEYNKLTVIYNVLDYFHSNINMNKEMPLKSLTASVIFVLFFVLCCSYYTCLFVVSIKASLTNI